MTHEWDKSTHKLIATDPQAFIDFVLPGAKLECIRRRPERLVSWEWELIMDALLEVKTPKGRRILLHYEFETYYNSKMPGRLLKYSQAAREEYSLPVVSCAWHLLDDTRIKRPPLLWRVPRELEFLGEKGRTLRFDYLVIEMSDFTPQDIWAKGQAALLPLLPLTRGGARRDVVEEMLQHLEGEEDLREVGFVLAWMKFARNNPSEQDWLKRRYRTMLELLRQEPLYSEILQEGEQRGVQKGIQQGLMAMQQTVIDMVTAHFAQLEPLARRMVAAVNSLERLQLLIVELSLARSQEETERILLSLGEDA